MVTRYNEFTDLVLFFRVKKMMRKIGIKCLKLNHFTCGFLHFEENTIAKHILSTIYSLVDVTFYGAMTLLGVCFLIFMFFARILAAEGPKKNFLPKFFFS